NPPIVDSHASLVAWMRLTALNVARNAIVAEARRTRRERTRERGEASLDQQSEPLDSLLARLDDEERALLRLRHVEGLRVSAIARAIGATPRAVESALRRLVERLRDGGAS
ncbi:MAG: Sigma-70, region 4, partial [Planctomycetota bacterium]